MKMRTTSIAMLLFAGVFGQGTSLAAPITVDASSGRDREHASETFNRRSNNSVNNVGQPIGDRLSFGVRGVMPDGSQGTVATARQMRNDGTFFVRELNDRDHTAKIPNFVRNVGWSEPRATRAWEVTLQNEADTLLVNLPTVGTDAEAPSIPLATDLMISGPADTPTFTWSVPDAAINAGATISRVVIRDLSTLVFSNREGSNPVPDIIHVGDVQPIADTDYTVPGGIILPGQNYVAQIHLELVRTVDQMTNPSGSSQIGTALSRSRLFIPFTAPTGGDMYVEAFYPTIDETNTMFFDFEVAPGVPYPIDPLVAIGFDYEIGEGDPNFASVLLPDVGDGLYRLWLFDMADEPFDTGITLMAGDEFDFTMDLGEFGIGAGGLGKFRIMGIETDAGVNPSDPVAFPTTLTFVSDGRFTGTMRAVVGSTPALGVPGPTGFALLVLIGSLLLTARIRFGRSSA